MGNQASTHSGRLLLRDGIRQNYPDVLTPAALDALEALAGFNRERQRIMRERIERRAARFRDGRRIGFLDPAAVIPRTALTVQQARAGQFDGSRDSPRPAAAVGPGHRPRHPAARDGGGGHPQRRLRPAFRRRRLDVRRRGRARPGRHHVARQSAQPRDRLCAPRAVPAHRRDRRGRDERLGQGLLRTDDHPGLEEAARLHHPHLPPPRPAPRRPARARPRRLRLLRLDRRRSALRGQQPPDAAQARAARSSCTCRRSRPPRRPHCGTRSSPPWSSTPACRRGRSRCTCWSSSSKPATS